MFLHFVAQIGDAEEEEGGGAGGAGGPHGGHHGSQAIHMDDEHDEHHGLDEASLKEHEEVTKVKVDCYSSVDIFVVHNHIRVLPISTPPCRCI